jgi:hypothetical protein
MVKSATGRRGRGQKDSTDLKDAHGKAPWDWEEQDEDPQGDLRDLYNAPEDSESDDYDWAAEEDEEDD